MCAYALVLLTLPAYNTLDPYWYSLLPYRMQSHCQHPPPLCWLLNELLRICVLAAGK